MPDPAYWLCARCRWAIQFEPDRPCPYCGCWFVEPAPERYLTQIERRIMDRALRRSLRITSENSIESGRNEAS